MMVLDVKIDKVITEKIAGKVFSNFSRFLLHLPLDLYILLIFSNMDWSNFNIWVSFEELFRRAFQWWS